MMPGRTLHRVASHLCNAKSLQRVVEPAIADLQKEYVEAVADGRPRGPTLLRGYLSVVKVIGFAALDVTDIASDDRDALTRTLLWSGTLVACVTLMLMIPPLTIVQESPGVVPVMFLIPQAFAIALPIGFTYGIALSVRRRPPSLGCTKTILLAAVIASIVSFATMAWVMPVANQAFREASARIVGHEGPIPKGENEMTIGELRQQLAGVPQAEVHRHRHMAWRYSLRWALGSAPFVLAAFAIVGSRRSVGRVLVFASCFIYWALLYVGESLVNGARLSPIAAAWLPNIVFMVATGSVRPKSDPA